MAKELDTDLDNKIDADLLGDGIADTTKFLRGDQKWEPVFAESATAPIDTAVLWLDTSGV